MIFLPILRVTLGSDSAKARRGPPPGPLESFNFPRNFNDFPSHTEVHPRLKFCEAAAGITPQDLWNPSFS